MEYSTNPYRGMHRNWSLSLETYYERIKNVWIFKGRGERQVGQRRIVFFRGVLIALPNRRQDNNIEPVKMTNVRSHEITRYPYRVCRRQIRVLGRTSFVERRGTLRRVSASLRKNAPSSIYVLYYTNISIMSFRNSSFTQIGIELATDEFADLPSIDPSSRSRDEKKFVKFVTFG